MRRRELDPHLQGHDPRDVEDSDRRDHVADADDLVVGRGQPLEDAARAVLLVGDVTVVAVARDVRRGADLGATQGDGFSPVGFSSVPNASARRDFAEPGGKGFC